MTKDEKEKTKTCTLSLLKTAGGNSVRLVHVNYSSFI
jgi:hypothetical protein